MLHSEDACIELTTRLRAPTYIRRAMPIYLTGLQLFEWEIRPTYVEILKSAHALGMFSGPRDIEEIKYIS
jgi:replicative DNA helicase